MKQWLTSRWKSLKPRPRGMQAFARMSFEWKGAIDGVDNAILRADRRAGGGEGEVGVC